MTDSREHSTSWKWWVSLLLLLATMINYIDRQMVSNLSQRITQQFEMSNAQYGILELVFGIAFALGSLFFGTLADRVSVRLLYPAVLVAWSAVGIATGLSRSYESMLVCRGLLGFFESGHWPCALIVTQAVMTRGGRVMGNSVLQSGASLGAIATPIIIRLIVADNMHDDAWRSPFFIIGGVGLVWAVLWMFVVRRGDLDVYREHGAARDDKPLAWLWGFFLDRRFWALAVMVISINTSWQLIRHWLPKFLQVGRGYSEAQALYFNSVYFIATDVGCILAGITGLWLTRAGMDVHRSRVTVFFGCSLLAALTTVAAVLPAGWPLLAVLLLVAGGTLGLFPCYYSFTQELSTRHLGKLTGVLSFIGWMAASPMQPVFGEAVDRTGSFDMGITLVGWSPMVGLLIFLLLWRERPAVASQQPAAAA
ncbi:MAG: MFS transporter [Planctomycetales bacterium]|nr:MFS transporter [Planctomycetales bacterium]